MLDTFKRNYLIAVVACILFIWITGAIIISIIEPGAFGSFKNSYGGL